MEARNVPSESFLLPRGHKELFNYYLKQLLLFGFYQDWSDTVSIISIATILINVESIAIERHFKSIIISFIEQLACPIITAISSIFYLVFKTIPC